ncbi:50S ribosomal protein L10 [Patescibacteria group bacterium]|nr:50S ribosomal protein L10 [Patescibacteria group bacterium]MBU4057655.1 50S ribosomal protein L10 [Patescibacteria group bacterium]MBU4115945.1 50S ribosomal protein L10 [Patescibacteria group bacterium]
MRFEEDMAITKDKKKEIVSKLKKVFDDAKTIVFVNFHGLNVSDTTSIRKELRKNNIGYFVAKKTLVGKALDGKKFEGEIPKLEGELGLVYSDDQLSPAREIYNFSKKHKEKLSILGGIFENKFQNKEKITELAQIPDILTLRGMFVNLVNSPIQRFVVVLNEIQKR